MNTMIEIPRAWLVRLVERATSCNTIEVDVSDVSKLAGLLGYIESATNLLGRTIIEDIKSQ